MFPAPVTFPLVVRKSKLGRFQPHSFDLCVSCARDSNFPLPLIAPVFFFFFRFLGGGGFSPRGRALFSNFFSDDVHRGTPLLPPTFFSLNTPRTHPFSRFQAQSPLRPELPPHSVTKVLAPFFVHFKIQFDRDTTHF